MQELPWIGVELLGIKRTLSPLGKKRFAKAIKKT